MYTLNDFFCGCGGMGLGFKEAGFTIVGAWDFDKYAVQSYRENVGDHVKQMSILDMTWKDVPKAQVWSFGFPCQDLSVAGKMKGLFEGKRSGLFFEVMRLLDETRENAPENLPVFLLAENVKGLKPYLHVLQNEYEQRGYTLDYTLFNSKYWGVPQNRERYFCIGTRNNLNVSFSFPVEQHDFVPKLSSILEISVDNKYYVADDKAEKVIEQALKKLEELGHVHATITPDRVEKRQNGRRAKEDEEPMFTLTAQDLHGVIIDDTYGYDGTRVYEEASPTLRSERNGLKVVEGKVDIVGNVGATGHHGDDIHGIDGVSPTVKARDYKGPIKILEPQSDAPQKLAGMFDDEKGKHQAGSVWNKNGVSPTLDTAQGGWRQPMIIERYRVRRLTPTEYGKLQGFPMDTWNQVVSNTQAYKQFGNAVTVKVAKAIALEIKESLKSMK